MQSMQSKKQFWAMSSVLLLTLTLIPRIVTMVSGTAVEAKTNTSPTQSVYLEFANVAEQLEAGKTAQAKRLLDRIGGEFLVVKASAGGDGALVTFSPTTLLIRVGRAMVNTALKEAKKGNRTESLAWIARCRELSSQVLATDTPNLDTLNLGRSLDVLAGRFEAESLKQLGDVTGAQAVTAREATSWKFYMEDMQPRIKALPEQEYMTTKDIKDLMAAYQNQRLRVTAMGPQSVNHDKS